MSWKAWGELWPTSKIWWAWNWRTPSARFGAMWGCWRNWGTPESRRMPAFTTRIKDNPSRRKRVRCINPRESFWFFLLNFMGGNIHSNLRMAGIFFGPTLWISWQKTLYRVFFELESAFSKGLYPMGNKSTMYFKGKKKRSNTTQASFILHSVLCSMYSELFMNLECDNIGFLKADEVYLSVM